MKKLETVSIILLVIGVTSLLFAFLKMETSLWIIGAVFLSLFLITPHAVNLNEDLLILKYPLFTRKYQVVETIPTNVFSIARARQFGIRIGSICLGYFSTTEGQNAFFVTTQPSALLVKTEKGLFVIDNPQ